MAIDRAPRSASSSVAGTKPQTTTGARWRPSIELDGDLLGPDATAGLGEFSHVEVVFLFDRVADDDITRGTRHPRGRTDWPAVGILAQRAKGRPNRIGVTVCELLAVDGAGAPRCAGSTPSTARPCSTSSPTCPPSAPAGAVRQPAWVEELMRDYW